MGRRFYTWVALAALLVAGCAGRGVPPAPSAPDVQPRGPAAGPSTPPQGGTPAPAPAAADPPQSGSATASTVPCRIPAPAPSPGYRVVHVYFTCSAHPDDEGRTAPVPRLVPETKAVLTAALTELLKGPSAGERAAGFRSFFSEQTAGALRRVTLAPDGSAVVDFTAAVRVPNASTSAGSAQILAELHATVFQFPSVRRVEFRLEGSCDAFWHWLQRECQWLDAAARFVPQEPGPVK